MKLIWLQVFKDVRMAKVLLLMFAGSLAADLAVCQGWVGEPDFSWPHWNDMGGFSWQGFIAQCAQVFGAILILNAMVQDTPARENGFLLTRPMPAKVIWIAKLIFVAGFVLAPALLVTVVHLGLSGVSGGDFAGIVGERAWVMLAQVVLVAGLTACTPSPAGLQAIIFAAMFSFGIGMAVLGGYSAITHFTDIGLPFHDPTPTALRIHGVMAIAGILLLFVARWIAEHRPSVRKASLVVGCAGMVATVGMAFLPADLEIRPAAPGEVEALTAGADFDIPPGAFGLGNWVNSDGTVGSRKRSIGLSVSSPELPADWSVEGGAARFTFTAEDGSEVVSVVNPASRSYITRQSNPPLSDLRAMHSLLPEVETFVFRGFQDYHRDRIGMQGGWIGIPGGETWWSRPVRIEASPRVSYHRWGVQANLPLAESAEQRDETGGWHMEASHYNTNSSEWEFVVRRTQVWRRFTTNQDQRSGRWWPLGLYRFLLFDPETGTALGFNSRPRSISETGRHHGMGSIHLHFGRYQGSGIKPMKLGDPMKFRLLILKRAYLGSAKVRVAMTHLLEDLRPNQTIDGYVGEASLTRQQINRRFADLTPPPVDADRGQVAQYVSAVLQMLIASRTYADRFDVLIKSLARYVPRHLPLFLDGLAVTSGPAERALREAVQLRITKSQLPELVAGLRRDPSLCGIIIHLGWLGDARDAVLALTDHPQSLDPAALRALALLAEDPRAAARLETELESGNQMAVFEILERDPAMRPMVERVVGRLWSRHVPVYRDTSDPDNVVQMAARVGISEAHRELLELLGRAQPEERHGFYNLLRTLRECTELPGVTYRDQYHQQRLADAASQVLDRDFRFDPLRRRFVPLAQPTEKGNR